MTPEKLMNDLQRVVDKQYPILVGKFPIKSLSLSKKEISNTMMDMRHGSNAITEGPIEIVYNIETSQFNVLEGYHRIVEFISKKKEFIPVKIWSTSRVDFLTNVPDNDLFFKPVPINSFVHSFLSEIYHDKLSDDEKHANAELYFAIGQEGPNSVTDKNYCWIWDGNNVLTKMGATHGLNFSHQVANRNFKGWYDTEKNVISVVFPEHELRKLGNRRPTEDDVPQYLYQKLISKFGKRKPKIVVFESKSHCISKKELRLILKEIANQVLKEPEYSSEEETPYRPYGGWLDEDLNFHAVDFEAHRSWAINYLDRNHPEERKLREGETTNDKMYRLGFIRIVIDGDNVFYQYDKKNPPEPRKIKAIKDLAIEYGCKWTEDSETGKVEDLLQESFSKSDEKRWWIDPKGKFYDVSKLGHSAWGEQYIKKLYGPNHQYTLSVKKSFQAPYDILYSMGWTRAILVDKDLFAFTYGKKNLPTPTVISAMKQMAKKVKATTFFDDTAKKEEPLKEIRLEPPVDVTINETMTYKELMALTTDDRKKRAADVRVRSIPVSIEEGQEHWNFRYKSSPTTTVTDEPFEGHIIFLKGEVEQGDDATDLDCKVDCSCPDYLYKWAWLNSKEGSGDIGPKSLNKCINKSPKPAYNEGHPGLCKHLCALGKYLKTKISQTGKSNLFEAMDDVATQGPFNVTYYD